MATGDACPCGLFGGAHHPACGVYHRQRIYDEKETYRNEANELRARVDELERFLDDSLKLRAEVADLRRDHGEQEATIVRIRAEMNEERRGHDVAMGKCIELERELNEARAEVQELVAEVDVWKEKAMDFKRAWKREDDKKIRDLYRAHDEKERERDEARAVLAATNEQWNATITERDEARAEATAMVAQADRLESALKTTMDERDEARAEVQRLKAGCEFSSAQCDFLDGRLAVVTAERDAATLRAERAEQEAARWHCTYPVEMDATDGACPAWWRGQDRANQAWRDRAERAEAEVKELRISLTECATALSSAGAEVERLRKDRE